MAFDGNAAEIRSALWNLNQAITLLHEAIAPTGNDDNITNNLRAAEFAIERIDTDKFTT